MTAREGSEGGDAEDCIAPLFVNARSTIAPSAFFILTRSNPNGPYYR